MPKSLKYSSLFAAALLLAGLARATIVETAPANFPIANGGSALGRVVAINCSGAGVTCTKSGNVGVITVAATESPLTFTSPALSRSSNAISCADATASTAGCLNAGAQAIGGVKTFSATLLPAADVATNLGSGSQRFLNGYFQNINDQTSTTRVDLSGTTTWTKGTVADGASAVANRVGNSVALSNAGAKVWVVSKDGTTNGSGDVAWVLANGKLYAAGLIVAVGSIDDAGGTGHIDFNAVPGTTLYSQTTDHQFRVGGVVYATVSASGVKIGTTGTNISASYRGTTTNPAIVNAQTCGDTAVTVTGAAVGADCAVGTPAGGVGANLGISCYVSATNTAQLHVCNPTAGNLTPTTGTYSARVFNP